METNTGNALGIFQANEPNQLFPVAGKLSHLICVYPTICTQMRHRVGREGEREGEIERSREEEGDRGRARERNGGE